ncbi:Protease HtpX homolog [Listeria monocytogenes N53-1]|nr:Protease HtpX homolog [Listeria monocytogenes]CCQ22576.1 Protease HtpX homolog [Listeria monocytogenes N53-1]
MSEIKVKEATLTKYATKLESKGKSAEYLPMKGGNMAYSQANSINHFRTALFDLVDAVDNFQCDRNGCQKIERIRRIIYS